MSVKSSGSVVNTKYGARPLIDMPPISLENTTTHYDPPKQAFHVPGGNQYQQNRVYHRPPQTVQPSLTMPPIQPRYEQPVIYQPQQPIYHQPSYQPQQPNLNQYPTSSQPIQGYPFSNVIQNSNIVPYDDKPKPQYRQPATAPPSYYPFLNTNDMQSQKDANGEVHIYYGPNGERLPGPPGATTYPTDFTLEGTLEYGKIVSVSIRNSNISYRDVPNFIFEDLRKTYGKIEHTTVKIVAQGGEYNIYATPHLLNESGSKYGYMYDIDRRHPVRRNSAYDPYTKIYSRDEHLPYHR